MNHMHVSDSSVLLRISCTLPSTVLGMGSLNLLLLAVFLILPLLPLLLGQISPRYASSAFHTESEDAGTHWPRLTRSLQEYWTEMSCITYKIKCKLHNEVKYPAVFFTTAENHRRSDQGRISLGYASSAFHTVSEDAVTNWPNLTRSSREYWIWNGTVFWIEMSHNTDKS